jgi:anti-sigma factor ChrR (cupin superfamily)
MTIPLSLDLKVLIADPKKWEPFREGIQVLWLHKDKEHGNSSALLKYDAGASAPFHAHVGYEHIFVLEGSQVDENGVHEVGNLSINPPGTSHNVHSPDGCIVLAVWEKSVKFLSA